MLVLQAKANYCLFRGSRVVEEKEDEQEELVAKHSSGEVVRVGCKLTLVWTKLAFVAGQV